MTRPVLSVLAGVLSLVSLLFCFITEVHGITVTQNTNAADLADALAAGATGIIVTGNSLSPLTTETAASSGTFTNQSGAYGIGNGMILSSGNVSDYGDGPNPQPDTTTGYFVPASPEQEVLLDPITGGGLDHWDVTQFTVTFDMQPGFDTVSFDLVFGSEEFPESVGGFFIDGFGAYLNGNNLAAVNGMPVNINHPAMTAIPGTELDGILAPNGDPLLTFTESASNTGNNLTFIVADTSDDQVDTTAYVASLRGSAAPTVIPEPGTILFLCTGLAWKILRKTGRHQRGMS